MVSVLLETINSRSRTKYNSWTVDRTPNTVMDIDAIHVCLLVHKAISLMISDIVAIGHGCFWVSNTIIITNDLVRICYVHSIANIKPK